MHAAACSTAVDAHGEGGGLGGGGLGGGGLAGGGDSGQWLRAKQPGEYREQ